MIRLGNFFFRHRNALFPLAFLMVFLPGPAIVADPVLAAVAGFCVAMLGQLLRAATVGLQYIVRGGRDRRVYAEGLVTEGLYAHSRNPMYVGNVLILIGVALVSNSWTCMAVALPFFCLVYVSIVAAEEKYLLEKFGQAYRDYMNDVPRWLLRLRGISTTFSATRFHWRRAILKEYGTPFGWIMGMAALGLWNLWREGEMQGRQVVVGVILGSMLGTLAIWATIRTLKKTRTLVAD